MGVFGTFKDNNSGLELNNGYISTYKSSINVSTLSSDDRHYQYYVNPSSKPEGWDEAFGCHSCGKFEIHAQLKIYADKNSRDINLREISVINISVFCNDTNNIYKCIYDKVKEMYPNLQDDI